MSLNPTQAAIEESDNGGPAFPLFTPDGHFNGSVSEKGMSLRDYFAANCPITFTEFLTGWKKTGQGNATEEVLIGFALFRFIYSDAMLKARETV